MSRQRFLSEGSELTEVWCKDVPNSEKVFQGMVIKELVEQHEKTEIYTARDFCGFMGDDVVKIEIFLDEKVQAGGDLRLAESSIKELDTNGNDIPRCVVFRVLEGDYDSNFYIVDGDEKKKTEVDTSETPEVTQNVPELTDVVDEDTGEVYSVDSNNYVWQDGEKTNMWFTSDGRLIRPKTNADAEEDEGPKKPKGFAAVAGMDDLKAEMLDEVKFVIDNKEKAKKYGLHLPNGMLLYGYPGCGKTFFAEKLAEELKVKFVFKRGSDLGSHWMHETEQNIATMFNEAKAQAPCILCIDEIDGFLPYRRGGEETTSALLNSEVNEFLSQMNNCGKDNVMVIGTTNNPSLLDPALLRTGRMDKLVYVPLPDEKAREEMLKLLLSRVPHDEDINYESVSEACDGMVMSDMEIMFHQLVLKCAREDKDITEEMLTEAAGNARRSVYVPKEDDEEEPKPMILKPADTHIKGFSMAI